MHWILTILIYNGNATMNTTSITGLTEAACHAHGAAVVAKAQVPFNRSFYVCTYGALK